MTTLPPTQPRQQVNWIRIAGTLLALALLIYLFSQQGWDEIAEAFLKIGWLPILAALALTLLSRIAITFRWLVLLRGGGLRISFYQTLRLTFAGLFASNFLPTTIGGDVARLAGAVQLKYDAAYSAASLIVDRLVGMAGMAMALPLGLPYLVGSDIFSGRTTLLGSPLPIFGLAANGAKSGWLEKAQSLAQRGLKRLMAALRLWFKHPRALLLALLFTWLHMLCLFFSIAALANALGEPISFALIAGLWSFVYFITLLPVSINGYGLQEISLVFIFTHLGGLSEPSGLMIALLLRTLQMLASLPGALFLPGIMAARQVAADTIT